MGDGEIAEQVAQHELPAEIRPVVDGYDQAIGERDRFLWQWINLLLPKITLSCVETEHITAVQNAKLLATILVTVLDDVAEVRGDRPTFEEAAKVPFDHLTVDRTRSGIDKELIAFMRTVWDQFVTLSDGPRTKEFEEMLRFDLKQILNAIEYSYIANNRLRAVNERELWKYDVHNMAVFVYADLDLMFSPDFDETELSSLRQVVQRTERMARIGNWITTWERELQEGDFSSGVIVYALEEGILSDTDLRRLREDLSKDQVDSISAQIYESSAEEYFRQRWQEEYTAAKENTRQISSVDIDAYIDGFEEVFEYDTACRGLK